MVRGLVGDVEVDGGPGAAARGRTNALLPVPMEELRERRRIRVTRDGREVYTGRVDLRAGEVTDLRVTPPRDEE